MTETHTHTPLPCPFCSSDAELESERCGWRVACQNAECATQGPWPTDCTEAEALTAWNTRADSHHRLVEALEAVEAAMLRGGDGRILDTGWSITKLNEARPLIQAALKEARHG